MFFPSGGAISGKPRLSAQSMSAASAPALVVAIPVKDEAERIGDCLNALAWQQEYRGHHVLLLLNNCTDATANVVRALAPSLPVGVHIVERRLPAARATAGTARSLAMRHAARLLGPDGILLTTDADGQVAPDWIVANLAAFRQGADVVAGQAVIDPLEAGRIPAHLHADDALECAYGDLLDEIDALLDPDPADPWPRHGEHSGASIAVRLDAYLRAGGVPAVPVGEDRAFLAALKRVDARIRHAPGVRVTVSGRIEGRAAGGMADTIRRRIGRQDPEIDDRLEPARDQARRLKLRARFRAARLTSPGRAALASALGVSGTMLADALAQPFVGAGWAMLEACSLALARRAVTRLELARETRRALRIRDRLLGVPTIRVAADRGGIVAGAAAMPA